MTGYDLTGYVLSQVIGFLEKIEPSVRFEPNKVLLVGLGLNRWLCHPCTLPFNDPGECLMKRGYILEFK